VLAAAAAHRLVARLQEDELLVAVAAQDQELAIARHGRHLGPAEDVAVEAQDGVATGVVEGGGRNGERDVVEALRRLLLSSRAIEMPSGRNLDGPSRCTIRDRA